MYTYQKNFAEIEFTNFKKLFNNFYKYIKLIQYLDS